MLAVHRSLHTEKKVCLMCTRMICRSQKHSQILRELESIAMDELIVEAPQDLKNILELMGCKHCSSALPLNCVIDRTKLNNCYISEEQEKFSDIILLGANHPLLIFFNFLTVASRISVNSLYESLIKRWHSGMFAIP